MICIIALVVFAILGVFSASHRQLAKEAFDCVFRRVTFRPCVSGLDQRLKAQIVSKSLGVSPAIGQFVHRHFELMSWLLTLSMFVSMFFAAQGLYNWAVYGSCDPQDPQNCFYNSIASAGRQVVPGCAIPANGSVKVDYFYSETCPYCKQQEPILDALLANYSSQVVLERHCIKIHAGDDALCIAKYGQAKYDADTQLARDIGLKATPTTVFNCHNKLVGIQTYPQLEASLFSCQKQG